MPFKRNDSKYWWTSYTDASGKRIRCSLGTTDRREAVALEAKFRLSVYRVNRWDEQPNWSYDELMLQYLKTTERKTSHQRDLDAAKHLTLFFRGRAMNELNAIDIRHYQEHRLHQVSVKGPVQPSTVNRETALLSSAINYAKTEWDWDIPNPVAGRLLTEPEGRDRHLSLEELVMLIDCAREKRPYLADFIELAVYTGCRKQELLGLEWGRVDLNQNLIYLQGHHTKSGKRRSVPINQTARNVLVRRQCFRAEHCPDSPWVFAHHNGDRIKDVKRSFKTVCRRAGIEDFRIHDLRHTCASLAVSEGVPLEALRDLLGHSSVTVTERYAHLAPAKVREAVAALDAVRSRFGHVPNQRQRRTNALSLVKG